ncbi:MAG: aminotransferase class I/II-fold pyridoxal phosphate-dependent enzyme [Gammaproteobacteria bacterium]|nr:aminotransferase class I/II-fold pyridoxal phosphate-dependent enzyme [Gammaproteobacteria bacterium]
MRYSGLTERVRGDAADAWDLHYEARQAQARGEDVIVLSVGDPDFATPGRIVERAVRAMQQGDTHYTSILGHQELRDAIAARHARICGRPVDSKRVITTSGAQNALFACAQCLLDAGDEAIVLQPMYVTYEATIQAPGARLVPVVLAAERGFRLDPEALEAAISERTRAIFYASPSNPTGIALNREELEYIAELARRHDLWIVADEVYGDFVFEGEFHPTAAVDGIDDRLVTIGSLSKSYAMSGWRVGWAVAPERMIAHLEKLALCMLYGLPGFIQQAGAEALTHCNDELARMAAIYRQRRDYLFAALDAMPGLKPLLPDAGMFMMVDVRGTGLEVGEFTRRLYDTTGVSLLDASAFGASAAGHVRVSCTVSDDELREACRRIGQFLENL